MSETKDTVELPSLSDETIARMEQDIFTTIDAATPVRDAVRPTASRKRRRWVTGIGIAAAFVAGAVVAPLALAMTGGGMLIAATDSGSYSVSDSAGSAVPESAALSATADGASLTTTDATAREIIQNASATVTVRAIRDGVDAVKALAEKYNGYVESVDVSLPTSTLDADTTVLPAPSEYGHVMIRVPAEDVTAVIQSLGDVGEVEASSVSQYDVTNTSIDLTTQVESLTASVDRLTALMAQSGSVSELVELETALSDRQAQLMSAEQQLAALSDQVAMASISVSLQPAQSATTTDPGGFNNGLLTGWNGLVASLNALIVTVGFLLPWLALAGIVWLIISLVRRGRRRTPKAPETP